VVTFLLTRQFEETFTNSIHQLDIITEFGFYKTLYNSHVTSKVMELKILFAIFSYM